MKIIQDKAAARSDGQIIGEKAGFRPVRASTIHTDADKQNYLEGTEQDDKEQSVDLRPVKPAAFVYALVSSRRLLRKKKIIA